MGSVQIRTFERDYPKFTPQIYRIYNNKLSYVGITDRSLEVRLRCHVAYASVQSDLLHDAISKTGWNNVKIEHLSNDMLAFAFYKFLYEPKSNYNINIKIKPKTIYTGICTRCGICKKNYFNRHRLNNHFNTDKHKNKVKSITDDP
jgi:hypothetical protein